MPRRKDGSGYYENIDNRLRGANKKPCPTCGGNGCGFHNVKVNPDGTISPVHPSKPSQLSAGTSHIIEQVVAAHGRIEDRRRETCPCKDCALWRSHQPPADEPGILGLTEHQLEAAFGKAA